MSQRLPTTRKMEEFLVFSVTTKPKSCPWEKAFKSHLGSPRANSWCSSLDGVPPEAAVRGVWQAQAEDLDVVDVDQLEKVLPQLVRGMQAG